MDSTMNNTPMYVTFASQANLLVGWKPNGKFLIPVCHKSFKVRGPQTSTSGTLLNVLPNEATGGVLSIEYVFNSTSSNGHVHSQTKSSISFIACSWGFRYTKNELLPGPTVLLFTLPVLANGSTVSVIPTADGCAACPILTQMLTNGRYPDSQISVTVGPSHSTRLLVAWKYEVWLHQLPVHELYFAKPANSNSRFSIPSSHLSNNSGWLHEHEITAVLMFAPLNLIITGDCSGCIKIWDDIFRQLAVLNNHLCEITHLVISPLSQSVADTQKNNTTGFASVDQTGVMKSWQFNKWCHLYCPTEERIRTKTGDEKSGQDLPISVNEVDTVHVFETCETQRSEIRNVSRSSVDILKLFMSQDGRCLTILGSRPTKSTIDANITLECWKAIELTRPFLRFPESISHISVAYSRENDEVNCYEKMSDYICQMVVLIRCVGSPGSVHLMSVPQYELLTTAVCTDSITDAVWYWPLERLFVLQQNHKLGVFSTADRPCSLLCEWGDCLDGDVTFTGPMHIYHSSYPDWLTTASKTNSILDQSMLLLLIGLSDGSLGILCPERGLLLTKTHAHQPVESNEHEIQLDAPVHIKMTHRLRYTRFPFELVRDVQLFCLYTAPSLCKNESQWDSTEREQHVNLCLESTLHKSSPILQSYQIETAHSLLPAHYCEQKCLTKSSCISADEGFQMEQFQDLFGYKQFLFSSVLQQTGCQAILNMKQVRFGCMGGDKKSWNGPLLSPSFKWTSMDRVNELGYVPSKSMTCQIANLQSLRIPVESGVRSERWPCSMVFTSPGGDLLLSINDQLYSIRCRGSTAQHIYFHQRLLLLGRKQTWKCNMPEAAHMNSQKSNYPVDIRQRLWNESAISTLNQTSKKLICDIQEPCYSDEHNYQTACDQSLRFSEDFLKLQSHNHDLQQLIKGTVTSMNHKRKQNLSKRERGIIKRHALENYLSGLLCNSGVMQLKMNDSNLATDEPPDEEVIILEVALEKAYKEQEILQQQLPRKHKRSKNIKTSRKDKSSNRRSALRKKIEPEPEAIQKPIEPSKQVASVCSPPEIDSYDNSMVEWNADPIYRSHGFFVCDALQHTGMWKYGWMPNSALIGTRYADRYQTASQDEHRQPVWRKPDLNALKLRLNLDSVDGSGRLTTDDSSSSAWFISSEDTTVDTTTRSINDLLTERLVKPEPEAEVLNSCVEREQECDLLLDEDLESSQTGMTHGTQKELKRLLTEGDAFNLSTFTKPRTTPQRSASFVNVDRKTTVFLTEIREDESLCEKESIQLPEFLKPYEHTRWLSALEQSYRNRKLDYHDPNSFIGRLVDSNFLLDVLTQQIPPCLEDETIQLCQTTVEICQAIGSIHAQYGLSNFILSLVHRLLISHCLESSHVQRTTILGVTSQQGGTPPWPVLWACICLLIKLGFRDIQTVALILSTYLLLEAVRKVNVSYASEKQQYLLKLLDHAGLKDPQHRLQNEMICLFKGGLIHESKTSSAYTKSHTALCEWTIGEGSDEFYWTKTIQIVQQWLTHWAKASETQYSEQHARKPQPQPKIPGVLSRRKAAENKRKNARKISWAESNDQVTIVTDIGGELKPCVTGIEAINAFCLVGRQTPVRTVTPTLPVLVRVRTPTVNWQTGRQTKPEVIPQHISPYHYERTTKILKIKKIQLDDQEMVPVKSLRDPTQPMCVQPWKAYQNALQGKFPPIVQLRLPKCALIPFGERESRTDMLWQRLVNLRKWKSRMDSLSQKQRERLLNISTEIGPFDSLLKDKRHLENYEQMLTHLILDCEGRMSRFVAWFMPSLSRVLPLVSSWKFPEIEQYVGSMNNCSRKSQNNLQLHSNMSDRLELRGPNPSEVRTFEMNDMNF
ncbi:hypothetical protein EG68_02448 [Paragonimus skrjabini miyazakii]|uniref:Uncharacterized protein n=1 Tax=Paragonimus skrjabini miyazakii TaxID=59628 RepID=A0A8S9Z8K1_9TREM|nr:hypothetical protein EG68_02448 [Paragonimus skrjabini miyazakii]